MATGNSARFNLPYPKSTDNVNVHGDIEVLVDKLEEILPPLGVSYFEIQVRNESGSLIPEACPVFASGYTTKTTIEVAVPSTESPILGLTKTPIANNTTGIVIVAGIVENVNTSSFANGDILYVGPTGGVTNIRPSTGSAAVGQVAYAATNGVIIVEAKGNGTWGALKVGLA